ncbi:MAG: hypothetical protein KBI41_08110 [Kiritimatiellae bacterium]|jgi:exosortase/archaeosortase family protein|nr:hypothetical protein [Kiritimatiellia bacterium]MDD2348214.1 hypothetical protein [Kiritimatiellia bacterium]MDD3583911.1 hypothetical protein [Kiritimatiellia bacterium]HHU13659.1 hypothetical protein [Lentisphaerota bacterium]HON48174.1 hypothetical protein [Kiritimatiellia bacterium]
MMELVCRIYAWTVAAVLSGVGWDMQAFGNVIVCGGTAVQVQPGCLAARAVGLVGLVGLVASAGLRQAWPFPAALAAGTAMSWLRCFTLVALCLRHPAIFERVHGQCGYAVFLASTLVLLVLLVIFRRTRCRPASRGSFGVPPRDVTFRPL